MKKDKRIIIFDTTLRDGEQTPGVSMNLAEKLEIAQMLESLGVDIIEAGFPAASQGDFDAVSLIAQNTNCTIAALCRCSKVDIDRAWEAIRHAKNPRLHVFIATSEIHMTHKLKMTRAEVKDSAVKSVSYAKNLCGDVEFSCEDASRSDPDFLFEILESVIDAGADTVNIPDTVGYAMPSEYGALISGIIKNVPNINKAVVSVHCHDDLGLAAANTLSAMINGALQIETTINGLGERAGNCAMEEIVMALTTRKEFYDVTHNIITTKIYETSRKVSAITGVPVSITKAIVGANAFAHESGIHQHGILSNPMTYEIMTPQSVGKSESTLVLGKLSGRHAFNNRLCEMGFLLNREELDNVFTRFKDLADRKKEITDDDIVSLIGRK